MRNLVLATVSVLALGIAGAGPLYAQGNTGTANPAPATPSATAPANPAAEPTTGASNESATGQTGADTATTPGSMSSSNQYGTTPYMTHGKTSSWHQGAARATRSDVRQAQEKLRQDGFYHGRIDGVDGPKTRQALRSYQKKNGLPVTARLDQNTMNELIGAGMGQGSSMPPGTATGMTPPASSAAGSSGSSNLNTGNYSGTSNTGK